MIVVAVVGVALLVGTRYFRAGDDRTQDRDDASVASELRHPKSSLRSGTGSNEGAAPPGNGAKKRDQITKLGEVFERARAEPEVRDAVEMDPKEMPFRPLDEEGEATHDYLRSYFSGKVAPLVKPCFSELGEGRVRFRYNYTRAEGGGADWTIASADAVEIIDSTLPVEQDDVALHCMREAVMKAPLPPTEADQQSESLGWVIYFEWQTPAPPIERE